MKAGTKLKPSLRVCQKGTLPAKAAHAVHWLTAKVEASHEPQVERCTQMQTLLQRGELDTKECARGQQ